MYLLISINRNQRNTWEWVLRELDQGVWTVTVVHAKFFDTGALVEIPDFLWLQFGSPEEPLVVHFFDSAVFGEANMPEHPWHDIEEWIKQCLYKPWLFRSCSGFKAQTSFCHCSHSQHANLWSTSKSPHCLTYSFPLWIILPRVLVPVLICKTDNVLVFLLGILTVLLTEHLLMSEIYWSALEMLCISELVSCLHHLAMQGALQSFYFQVASLYLVCLLVQSLVLTVFLLDDEMGCSHIQSGILALATNVTFYLAS